ncbi:hypothetical protein KL906_001250 [Ogataea polymorpha]|uniref:UDENN domain-containing protein n=1 Tax=Ogataea polymorpha TaxID=460523 RepID=A0A9P8PKJ3_9ASCO|nr:hypothetical protein KL906_001250 [Ogataea polymorpha]KAG7933381.1 hypothetical protein KL934_003191 [Ogataea polymorpha]KAH3673993.1 hypothetical protein OGATHE_001973 [Ogataea polymorpha]
MSHDLENPWSDAVPPTYESSFVIGLCIVDFDHVHGPEIEYWLDDRTNEYNQASMAAKFAQIWPQLPFQGLPDGAHLFDETFTNFTLVYDEKNHTCPPLPEEKTEKHYDLTTLFGCACVRQLNSSALADGADFKRSIIQKSVVMITRYPIPIQLKEKLSIITMSYFDQHNFHDKSIIKALFENVTTVYNSHGFKVEDDDLYETPVSQDNVKVIKESDFYTGLNLKELVVTFKRNLLVVYKALLLEQRILVYSKNLNRLSNFQYSLLSLIPNLLLHLSDSGSPLTGTDPGQVEKPTSLKSSDRQSMLAFMGLPLRIFGRGGFFQPYLTLQQIGYLTNENTSWYLVGCSNDIILHQKTQYADLVVNLDDASVELLSPQLKEKVALTSADRRFVDSLSDEVLAADEVSVSLANSPMESQSYRGGDDFIRYNFEDYLIGMLSSIKYDNFRNMSRLENVQQLSSFANEIEQFGNPFVAAFRATNAYKIFDRGTDDELFNFFEPKHVGSSLVRTNVIRNLFSRIKDEDRKYLSGLFSFRRGENKNG